MSDANELKLPGDAERRDDAAASAGHDAERAGAEPGSDSSLLIACSDANVVAVADISEARSRLEGFIPAGWYPTAARVLADGRVLVLNGRGLASYPNPLSPGPQRSRHVPAQPRSEYVAYYADRNDFGDRSADG